MPDLADALTFAHGPAWANRVVVAPLTNTQSHADGLLSRDEHNWLVRRADGGFGMVMTAAAHVSADGQCFPGQLGVWDDRFLPGLTRLADGLRASGAVSSLQLQHGGRRTDPSLSGHSRVGAWADGVRQVSALTTDGIRRVVNDFVDAAVRAEMAGFDGVEVHGAHGYLICQFLDGRHNLRDDGYGGSFADRFRMLMEILVAIRGRTGPAFQLGLRLSPERNGVVLSEARTLAREVMASGLLDYLDMSLWDVAKTPHEDGEPGLLIEHFTALPRLGTRLGVAGKILSAQDARWCLDQGADFVLIGTGAILHHDFAARALAEPDYVCVPTPVTREHLEAEAAGPAFVDYLATTWDDFVVPAEG